MCELFGTKKRSLVSDHTHFFYKTKLYKNIQAKSCLNIKTTTITLFSFFCVHTYIKINITATIRITLTMLHYLLTQETGKLFSYEQSPVFLSLNPKT